MKAASPSEYCQTSLPCLAARGGLLVSAEIMTAAALNIFRDSSQYLDPDFLHLPDLKLNFLKLVLVLVGITITLMTTLITFSARQSRRRHRAHGLSLRGKYTILDVVLEEPAIFFQFPFLVCNQKKSFRLLPVDIHN